MTDKKINFHYVSGYFTTSYNGFVEQPEKKLSSPQDDILGVKKYNFKTKRPISTICQIKHRSSHVLTVHSSPLPAQLILIPQHCKWKHQQQKFLHLSICNIHLPPNTFFFFCLTVQTEEPSAAANFRDTHDLPPLLLILDLPHPRLALCRS